MHSGGLMSILTQLQEESLRSQGLVPLKNGAYLDDGTFSTVISVVNEENNQKFAVKIVDKLLVIKNDKCKAILEEKRIHLSLEHFNIIKLYSTFQDEQSLYFVLELCEGNLLKYKSKLSSLPDIFNLSKQLISSVHYLHSQNILHRDIKPENILIDREATLKLADFGSAMCLNNSSDLGELNKFVGTPEYLAPEILKSSVKMDENVFGIDWWAVGCTIYWLLTDGKVLFEARTEYLVYKSIESGPSMAAVKECCDLDGRMGEIIFGLLENDPKRRVNFVKEQLKSLLEE